MEPYREKPNSHPVQAGMLIGLLVVVSCTGTVYAAARSDASSAGPQRADASSTSRRGQDGRRDAKNESENRNKDRNKNNSENESNDDSTSKNSVNLGVPPVLIWDRVAKRSLRPVPVQTPNDGSMPAAGPHTRTRSLPFCVERPVYAAPALHPVTRAGVPHRPHGPPRLGHPS